MADLRDVERLRAVVRALGDITDDLVFVGGTVTSLLITDAAAPAVRETNDVDAILGAADRNRYYLVEARLRARGFRQDHTGRSPVCRWFHEDSVLDVMPDDELVLGFSNRWYARAYETAVPYDLSDRSIRVIGAVWFLATKLEAFKGRGNDDFQASRDIEDIVAVLDGRPGIVDETARAPDDVRAYLRDQISALLEDERFVVALAGHLGGDATRTPIVYERMSRMAVRD